ncbi:MAG: hypothetical protein ABIQ88_07005 [Chitinophagaceae bacterium]
MQYKKNILTSGNPSTVSLVYLLLTISGLSFCFFLGFPFNNHNESFIWVVTLNKISLWDALSKQVIGGVESFRPLGMANAWLSYKISGNIFLQEILNWLFAISSFALLYTVVKNKVLFAILAFLTCACFFAGYIYLFHLHGVFYGPFQLYVALLACVAVKKNRLSVKMLALTSAATIIACLYHTFALLVFCAFLAGYIIQLLKKGTRKELVWLIVTLLLTLAAAKLILQTKQMKTMAELADGLLTSFKMMEINRALSAAAVVLATLAGLSLAKTRRDKIITATAVLLLSALLIYLQIPVLPLWVIICAVKMLLEKNWVMAGLIAAAAILPVGSSSGSPTYLVFVLMICAFVTAADELYIKDTRVLRGLTIFLLVTLAVCLAAVKKHVPVPVASSIVRPVLAEQEKTKQLQHIVEWKIKNKEYASSGLYFYDGGGLPVNAENAVNRVNRPVTDQAGLNEYLDFLMPGAPNSGKADILYITFGNKLLQDKQLVFSVNGPWNGNANVFR